jgi:hypothetical protein
MYGAYAGISHCLDLSLASLDKNEPLLSVVCYFSSNSITVFLFGHGQMTPTLMDVFMLTDLNVSKTYPWSFKISPSHKLAIKDAIWKRFIETHRTSGPVTDREHSAFLMMWLEYFVFGGSPIGPSNSFQHLTEYLSSGNKIPLGKYLLGATYSMLDQVSALMIKDELIGNLHGPWWFLQLWLHFYTSMITGLDLQTLSFPNYYPEGA